MVKLRLAQLLKQRRMNAYALSKETGLSLPTVYNLTRAGGLKRMEVESMSVPHGNEFAIYAPAASTPTVAAEATGLRLVIVTTHSPYVRLVLVHH